MLFLFLRDVMKSFNQHSSSFASGSDKVIEFLEYKKLKIKKPTHKMPNIIFLQLESMEKQCITPIHTPFLYNLSKNVLYIDDIKSQIYTTWTAGSMMALLCNIPHLVTNIRSKVRAKDSIGKYEKLACFPDFLDKLGYKNEAYFVNEMKIMGISDFVEQHHTEIHENVVKNDLELFDFYFNKSLPDLLKRNKPFFSYLCTDGTHYPYLVPNFCTPEIPESESRVRKVHNCADQLLRVFYRRFLELGLNKNTELIIFGDHLVPTTKRYIKWEENIEMRRLFLYFASRPPMKIDKPITYYDVAPTIMNIIGASSYSPRFPYGKNIFSSETGIPPNENELTFLFNYFADKMGWKMERKFICQKGRVSDTVCSDTKL